MPIPYDMTSVLSEFLRKIECYDEIATIKDFEYGVKKKTPSYYIYGVLIPPSSKDLQFFDEGQIRNGAITLYTSDKYKLHMVKEGQETDNYRQTYVRFEGEDYRVIGVMNRSSDGRYMKWLLNKSIQRKVR